jgi:error-prone DNA polymerase
MGHRIGKDRPRWGELLVTSNHTFLCGASHPEELVREAFRLGHDGMALTDLESFGGAVRAHAAAREVDTGRMPEAIEGGFRLAHGVRVRLAVDPSVALAMDEARSTPMSGSPLEIVLYASDRASWGALCRLLTTMRLPERVGMHGRPAAGARELLELLHAHPGGAGILGVLVPPTRPDHGFLAAAGMLACAMPERLWVAMRRTDDVESSIASERACHLAEALRVPVVACSDVRMHAASRRPLLDVLACIRQGVPIDRAGELVARHAERRLRRREEILVRYADRPDAVAAAWRVLERASAFSLDQLRYEYPDEVVPQGVTPSAHLRDLAWRGARERYPRGVPATVARQMEHEFEIIDDLSYAPYFLTVHDIVAFARGRGILCQGRGAAANSAVCYALGVTAVDPARIDVLFERFVSRERNEPPDIDIDFEHERREEVLQYVYGKYGRERAALVCEVVGYRGRSAVRDVAKALGFSPDTVSRLASSVDRWSGGGLGGRDDLAGVHADAPPVDALSAEAVARLREAGLDPSAPRSRLLVRLVGEILGFPRHRSQHVGGFVISRGPLCESVPIERAAMECRSVLEWDKDDVEALGMLKIDLLSLGMLTAIRKSIALVKAARRTPRRRAATSPRSVRGRGHHRLRRRVLHGVSAVAPRGRRRRPAERRRRRCMRRMHGRSASIAFHPRTRPPTT